VSSELQTTDPLPLPLPPEAPAVMIYLDRETKSPRLRALLEQAKAKLWKKQND